MKPKPTSLILVFVAVQAVAFTGASSASIATEERFVSPQGRVRDSGTRAAAALPSDPAARPSLLTVGGRNNHDSHEQKAPNVAAIFSP
jgi:hypothetical protein